MSCFFSKFSFLNVKELTFISQDFCQSKSWLFVKNFPRMVLSAESLSALWLRTKSF
jgi:hypothetical protein